MNRASVNILKMGVFVFLVCGASALFAAETSNTQMPRAVIPEATYEFTPVVEGDPVPHDFVIQNKGTAVLNILDVQTSCGCTTASVPGPIEPGKEGVVSIKFNSEGRTGDIQKTITVKTDDPVNGEITLVLKGKVEKMYTLTPASVKLSGVAGEALSQTLTIVPEKAYAFSLTGITAKRGENIKYRYQEIKDKDGVRIEVIVENTRKEVGPYFDTLTLQTDSARKPEIKIQVFGSIKKTEDRTSREQTGKNGGA